MIAEALETLTTIDPSEALIREQRLEKAAAIENLWEAFEIIKKVMGSTEFNATIRSVFEGADRIDTPEIYNDIWGLSGVSGMLTLNIDGFSARSHRRTRPMEDVASFVGRSATDYVHLVSAAKPFIANLHGIHESASSWIFTGSDIRHLISNLGYKSFLQFIFSNATVVFSGISADDSAAGGILAEMTKAGLDLGQHFWITDRRDVRTDNWGAKSGVQLIRYEPDPNLGHEPVIREIISDLKSYVSTDTPAATIVPEIEARSTLPSVAELRMLDDDSLRTALAGYAKSIVSRSSGNTNSDDYRDFLKSYSPSIHQARHITDQPPFNKFYDFTVIGRISSGTFSNVWRLSDRSGNFYALKIIQIDNLSSGTSIESFRRGVQSLEYLTNAQVPSAAKIVQAYEIPTSLVMSFIEGDTLGNVASTSKFSFWRDGLPIIQNICRHLEFAHNLPQGVLHRDVRPSNIMLPYYYWNTSTAEDSGVDVYEAILLNYDMSWHARAEGSTIGGNISESGYYAPEQVADSDSDPARTTQVDSYGLAMTVFYAYTKQPPPMAGSSSVDWEPLLRERFRSDSRLSWRSAPERLRRVVEAATKRDWQSRITIPKIRAELAGLSDAIAERLDRLPPDMWAEELMSRVIQNEYVTNEDGSKFSRQLKVGRTVELSGELSSNSVFLHFRNTGTGDENWTDASKRWSEKLNSAKDILTASGWEVLSTTRAAHLDIILGAKIEVATLIRNTAKAVSSLEAALNQVRLD